MDSLMDILNQQYEQAKTQAEDALDYINHHCTQDDPPIHAVITKYREDLDDAVRGMVAVAHARIEAKR